MEKTSLNIRMLYSEMGKAEKQIADWIEQNPGKIISMSIVDLAEQCKCSEATIVRFSKRLGLSGYQELKISLASEGGSSYVSTNIKEDDNAYDIYTKVCNDIYMSLEKTKKSLIHFFQKTTIYYVKSVDKYFSLCYNRFVSLKYKVKLIIEYIK